MKRRMIRGLSFEPESDRPLSPPRRVTPPKRTAAARDKKTKLSTGTRATALCRARPDSRMTRRRDCPAGRQVRRIRSPCAGTFRRVTGNPGVRLYSIPRRMNSQTKPVSVNMLRPLESTAVSADSSGTAP